MLVVQPVYKGGVGKLVYIDVLAANDAVWVHHQDHVWPSGLLIDQALDVELHARLWMAGC